MAHESAYDTAAIETLEEEIPDRLRNLVEEHHPNIRQILVQQKKSGHWRVIKKRIKGVSGLELDYVCQEVVRIVRDHAEGSESDGLYRAKLDIGAADGTKFERTATIKTKVGGDGDIDIDDGTEHEERTQLALLRDVMDSNQVRETKLFDKAMECLTTAQEQSRENIAANTAMLGQLAEVVGQYTAIGEGMNGLLTGVTGMIATGVELHSSHAQSQADVQIAQLEHESEAAKWATGATLLGKIMGPLGGQIAASFGGKKKAKVSQVAPTPVSASASSANEAAAVATVPAANGDPPKIEVLVPTEGWEKGRAAQVKIVMAKFTEEQRKTIVETMGESVLESFEDAAKSDENAATYLPVIRAGIEQRLQQNEYAQHMQMAKLSGSLGDRLTGELFELLPPAPEQ